MIPHLHERAHRPQDPFEAALGRPVSLDERLTECTVVAHWPGLDLFARDDVNRAWTSVEWAEHLVDPRLNHPFPATPPDGRAFFHTEMRLAPHDRELARQEWAEVAHRLARAAGIEVPGKEQGARWIGVQARPGRLDLIANLIHIDGTWHAPPGDIARRLADEARCIERDLHLAPPRSTPTSRPAARAAPRASAQLAAVLTQLADEHDGPLAVVRGLIEHTAHRTAHRPGAAGTAHSLLLLARRVHAVQEDLHRAAAGLAQPPVVVEPPVARRSAHRSP
ncbi:relaxase/mobilization nuclease [Streptomyces griseus]|uniref:relaxase/mobilization nuclease n=1 Tax=Streptomyces griseus TaxID=1911 RepID=UPI0038707069|nr:relaxase/mobilization nuclease [Streptomyces fimicarius]